MSSPSTPRHSRKSTMELSMSASASPQDRRQSKSSFNEPSTPTHHLHSSFGHGDNTEMFSSSGIGGLGGDGLGGGGGGLGNLADELADALSDGDDDDDEYDYEGGVVDGEDMEDGDSNTQQHHSGAPPNISLSVVGVDGKGGLDDSNGQRDSGVDVASPSSPRREGDGLSLNLPTANGGGRGGGGRHHQHNRTGSVYDGSEYGSDSDLDSPGMSPNLVAKIDAVESLARRGTEDNGGPTDGVCKRLTEELRDLGSQSNVEGGASRLITAHSALTTHLTHQTRQLHALSFPLFSPLAMLPFAAHLGVLNDNEASDSEDPDNKEDVMTMLTALAEQIPRPSTTAYQSLTALHTLTNDLVSTLSYLSDTLHMARQTTTTATRRLRSAKELVAELRRDEAMREEGEEWLARGNWNERLQRRECAMVCGDVVGGFEAVCNDWRARLLAQAEAAQATA